VNDFVYLHLGARAVKGKTEKITVYKVLDRRKKSEPAVRGEGRSISSPLLGRENEIRIFLAAIDNLLTGRGGLVSVFGEAGMGKSRLLLEVKRLAASKDLNWLEGRARPVGRMLSYRPFQEIIKSDAGIVEDDDAAASWDKLDKRISKLFGDTRVEILPYIATLLTLDIQEELEFKVKYLDAQAMGHQIFRSVKLFFECLAQEKPLLLLFEDVHWIDQSSARLLEHIMPLVETVPILICLVSRPERNGETTTLAKTAAEKYPNRYNETMLQPLSPFDCGLLLRNLLKTDELSTSLVELIIRKAEGNPFFVEEVVRALIDVGGLNRDERTGGWRATSQANAVIIPDTLQALIMSRIDRLKEDLRQALKTASVIGRNFFYRLLVAVDGQTYTRPETLEELQHLELIRERSRIPDLEYSFKHALVHESAYESVILQRRQELHRLVGRFIEELYADRLEEFFGVIAYHYAKAGEWEKAQDYLLKVGDQAGKMAADAEALEHYHQALAAYEQSADKQGDPFQRAVIERKIGEALFRRGNHDNALETLHRALVYLGGRPFPCSRGAVRLAIIRELIRQLGHRLSSRRHRERQSRTARPIEEERGRIYEAMTWIHYFVDQESMALDTLLLLNLSEEAGLPRGEVQGLSGLGTIFDLVPVFWLARRYHQRAVSRAEEIQDPVSIGHAYLFVALHEHNLGKWSGALEHYEQAAASYRKAGHLRGWGAALSLSTSLLTFRGKLTKSFQQANEMVRVGQDAADAQLLAWGLPHLSVLVFLRGGTLDDARAHADRALEIAQAIPDYITVAAVNAGLGWLHFRYGKLQQGLPMIKEGMRLISEKHLRNPFTGSAQLLSAEVLLAEAEVTEGTQRESMLREADEACKRVLNRSRTVRALKAHAHRLQGLSEWLNGKPIKAREYWRRSLEAANELGSVYDLARTHFEIGRCAGELEHLKNAEAIFADIGANSDLRQTRELLKAHAETTLTSAG
jgi:tetratricopeptide (TPR) repeat protein